jgi:hypothetical protein
MGLSKLVQDLIRRTHSRATTSGGTAFAIEEELGWPVRGLCLLVVKHLEEQRSQLLEPLELFERLGMTNTIKHN